MLHTKSIFHCYLRLVKCNTKIGQKKRKSIKGRVRKTVASNNSSSQPKNDAFLGGEMFQKNGRVKSLECLGHVCFP